MWKRVIALMLVCITICTMVVPAYADDYKTVQIEYYFNGVIDNSKTQIKVAKVGDIVDKYVDYSDGNYSVSKTENFPLTVVDDYSIIRIYYQSKDYVLKRDFTYKYYYDGVEDTSARIVESYKVGTLISEYKDKCKTGYVLDKVDGLPAFVTESGSNSIRIYYKKVPTVEKVSYTIEYYYDGVKDNNKTEKRTADEGTTINSYPDKAGSDYQFSKTENKPLKLSSGGKNVMKVYYVSKPKPEPPPETQPPSEPEKPPENPTETPEIPDIPDVPDIPEPPKEFTYKIEYYYNGILDETKTIELTAIEGTVIEEYEDKLIEGYEFDKVDNCPLTIVKDGENVLKVYYKEIVVEPIEPEHTTDDCLDEDKDGKCDICDAVIESVEIEPINVDYTIEYYFDGVLDETLTEKDVKEDGEMVSTFPDKAREGYILDTFENMPLIVIEGAENVIRIYYVQDVPDVPDDPQEPKSLSIGTIFIIVVAIAAVGGIAFFLVRVIKRLDNEFEEMQENVEEDEDDEEEDTETD